jgi:uncharacterized membrane protein
MKSISLFDVATLFSLVGSGLIAGVFFIFSVCIMRVLGSQPPAQGIATMQAISVVIINPWFMTVFLGTAILSVYLIVAALVGAHGAGGPVVIAASLAYVAGSVLVTMAFNVPRNDALVAVSPDSAAAARLWVDYLSSWTAWNHVRTIASGLATALFGVALWLKS